MEEEVEGVAAGLMAGAAGRRGGGADRLTLAPDALKHQEGNIFIDGHRITDVDVSSLRSRVAVVQQDAPLMNLTIRDNVAYGRPDASEEDIVRAAQLAQAHDFISQLPHGCVLICRWRVCGRTRRDLLFWLLLFFSGKSLSLVLFPACIERDWTPGWHSQPPRHRAAP